MKDIWTKFLCCFIGWDYKLLSECSTASKKALHRYAGAVFLLMLIWAYIGYGMANRYFKIEQEWLKNVVAIIFSFVIWLIERQIILIVGKNKVISCIRLGLAGIMALIGATIIDQTLLAKDIDAQKIFEIEYDTDSILKRRRIILEAQQSRFLAELDSLEKQSSRLTDEINKQPHVHTWVRTACSVDSFGEPIYATNQILMPNPKIQDKERINARIDKIQKELDDGGNRLQALRDSAHKEAKENFGLLRELKITLSDKVIFSGWQSEFFYLLIFLFFFLVECFVVTGKMFSKKSDYEILVERQQERKIKQIESILPIEKNKEK